MTDRTSITFRTPDAALLDERRKAVGETRTEFLNKLIANLVINPDGQKVMPLVVGAATLKVSHDSVNGMREIFIEEFDCRQRQRS